MPNMPVSTLEEKKQFASDLMLMKNRASRLGLYKTMQALEPATQAVGYEIAEMIDAGIGDSGYGHQKENL